MNEIFPETAFKPVSRAGSHFVRGLRGCRKLKNFAALFSLVLLIFTVLGCRMFQASPHKTDAQLTTEFKQNKEKLNRLVAMVKEDKIWVSVYEIEKGYIKKISSSRIAEYKKLLDELKLLGVSPNKKEKDAEPVTQIYFKSTDYRKEGEFYCKYTEEKGFVWYESGKQPANREVKNLDREYIKGEDVKAESKIDDNWSLYYIYETCYYH